MCSNPNYRQVVTDRNNKRLSSFAPTRTECVCVSRFVLFDITCSKPRGSGRKTGTITPPPNGRPYDNNHPEETSGAGKCSHIFPSLRGPGHNKAACGEVMLAPPRITDSLLTMDGRINSVYAVRRHWRAPNATFPDVGIAAAHFQHLQNFPSHAYHEPGGVEVTRARSPCRLAVSKLQTPSETHR